MEVVFGRKGSAKDDSNTTSAAFMARLYVKFYCTAMDLARSVVVATCTASEVALKQKSAATEFGVRPMV
jgi:hypothetical protein